MNRETIERAVKDAVLAIGLITVEVFNYLRDRTD